MDEVPENVRMLLHHVHDVYGPKLNIPENIHVICGYLDKETSVQAFMGVSTPHQLAEKACFAGYQGNLPEDLGSDNCYGMFAIYFGQPVEHYEETGLGFYIELYLSGEAAAVSRYMCRIPPDFPNTMAGVEEVVSFEWEDVG